MNSLCHFLHRKDCLRLLSSCTNSSVVMKYCDILATTSIEADCISLDQFLTPSVYGNDVVSPIAEVTHNPCDPNPCAEGFFCSINRLCDSDDQSCTLFNCQLGCVIGTRPGIVLPKSHSVRVSLVSHSQEGCYGYLNCTTTAEDLCKFMPTCGLYFWYSHLHDFFFSVSNDGNRHIHPIMNDHCEEDEKCNFNETLYGMS